jgi:N-acetylneuraminic acid mutarotase
MGGQSAVSIVADCDEYVVDSWANKTDIPVTGRQSPVAATIGLKAYVACGIDGAGAPIARIDEFTPAANTWANKTNCTAIKYAGCGSTISDKIYVCYGSDGSYAKVRTCYEYVVDAWATKTQGPLPTRNDSAACTISGKMYVMGGTDAASLRDNDEYSPDTWTSKTDILDTARLNGHGAAAI